MRPISLTATNYVRFPSLAVTFAEGSCAVTGPNGAGKSAVLRAIDLALFADGSKDLARWLAPFDERMELLLEFEHAGERYRVRRTYKGGASAKATLDLDRLEASDAWLPLTLASTKETQAELERILGLNRRTFAASSYLAQGNDGSLTKATPAERKDLIASAIDPRGYWPGVAQKASEERKACERALEADRIRIEERVVITADGEGLALDLRSAEGRRDIARIEYDNVGMILEDAQAALAANAAAAERLKAARLAEEMAREAMVDASGALAVTKEQAAKLEPAAAELRAAETSAERVAELERLVEERREQDATVDAAKTAKAAAQTVVERTQRDYATVSEALARLIALKESADSRYDTYLAAEANAERCDRCAQILGAEALEVALNSAGDEVVALEIPILQKIRERDDLDQAVLEAQAAARAITIPELAAQNGYDGELRQARAAAERLSGLRERIATYEAAADRTPALNAALGQAEAELERRAAESARLAAEAKDDAELKQAAESARSRQTQARAALDAANAAVTRLEEQLARVKQAEAELEALRGASRLRQSDLDLLRLAERAFGRDGIPTLIVENTLAQIETNANTYLAMMPTRGGRVTLRVELETQAKQKTVEHLKETLDIMVCDADTRRHYESFSGSEQSRLDFALGLSLAILLADRRGAESRVLLLDELEGLDEQGQRDVVKVVESVRSRFDLILVASHYQGIRDAFDQVLSVVVDDDDVSRIAA